VVDDDQDRQRGAQVVGEEQPLSRVDALAQHGAAAAGCHSPSGHGKISRGQGEPRSCEQHLARHSPAESAARR
jgi:hypothetical protein